MYILSTVVFRSINSIVEIAFQKCLWLNRVDSYTPDGLSQQCMGGGEGRGGEEMYIQEEW